MSGVSISGIWKPDDGQFLPRMWSPISGDELPIEKQQHMYCEVCDFGLAADAPPTATVIRYIWTARAGGNLKDVSAFMGDTGTTTALSFNLNKSTAGGAFASVLSAAISVTQADADRTWKAGPISAANYVAGDVFEAVMTFTTNTGSAAVGPLLRLQALTTGDD